MADRLSNSLNDAIATLNSKFSNVSLCPWGTYYTVGTKITLTSNATNFRFLLFIIGYSNANEKGIDQLVKVPSVGDLMLLDASTLGSPGKYIELKLNSATELEVKGVTSGIGLTNSIRQVFGVY